MYDRKEGEGIAAISQLLKDKYGFSQEVIRTLVLKNPHLLGKSRGEIDFFFDFLKRRKGIDELTTMKMLYEIPSLIQVDLVAKTKEIDELFGVYHNITPEEVTDIFLAFPYLYCVPAKKI